MRRQRRWVGPLLEKGLLLLGERVLPSGRVAAMAIPSGEFSLFLASASSLPLILL